MKKLLIAFFLIFALPVYANDTPVSFPDVNQIAADMVQKAGGESLEKFSKGITKSLPNKADITPGGIPIDIRAGLFIVEGLSVVSRVVFDFLTEIIIWLIAVFTAFWIGLEAFAIMRAEGPLRPAIEKIVKRGLFVSAAIFFLSTNPADWFMYFLGPLASLGNAAADLFLGATTGIGVSETCADVRAYVTASGANFGFMATDGVGDIMCITGRISGFFYNGLISSLSLIATGAVPGVGLIGALIGVAGAAVFIYCIFKFAFLTLGVIIDIMLALMFLPFVVFFECFKGGWNEKTEVGKLFASITKSFGSENLGSVIQKFIQSIIYIIAISLVSGLCFLLANSLSGGEIDMVNGVFKSEFGATDILPFILGAVLCGYMISKGGDFAKDLGGSIDASGWADKVSSNVSAGVKYIQKSWKTLRKFGKDVAKGV